MAMRSHTIAITGGVQGLGLHLVSHLAGRGHEIIVFDIKPFSDVPCEYSDLISTYREVDLADISSLQRAIGDVIQKHKCISVLINNAALRVFRNFNDFDEQDIMAYANVNLVAPILLIKRFFPMMKANGYGRIINIASKSAYWGYSTGTLYSSTKSALVNFTEAFGRELDVDRDDITINAICPDSFSSLSGKRFKGHEFLVSTIVRLIEELLVSKRNGEIIPILLGTTKIREILRRFYETYVWFRKY